MPKVKVEIQNITCRDTEDAFGADQLYYIANLQCQLERPSNTAVEEPIQFPPNKRSSTLEINDGETKRFDSDADNVIFEADCGVEDSIVGSIYFFDRDNDGEVPTFSLSEAAAAVRGRDFLIGGIGAGVLVGVGFIFGAPLALLGPALLFLTGAILRPIVTRFLASIGIVDRDDYLGGLALNLPSIGNDVPLQASLGSTSGIDAVILDPNGRTRTLRFGATSGSVDYTVELLVRREAA